MGIRRCAALALAGALTLGVASAASLADPNAVTLSAGATQRDPCQVGRVEFLSDGTVLGGLLDLPTTVVDEISLDLVAGGDCGGLRPVVVVYGDPNVLDGVSQTVTLSRTELAALTDASDVVLPVDEADELNTLLGLVDEPTQVRVAFCPDGVTACEP